MATAQSVVVYDQPTGVGTSRLICRAVLVSDAGAGQSNDFLVEYLVELVGGDPTRRVKISRDDFLAIRQLRGMP